MFDHFLRMEVTELMETWSHGGVTTLKLNASGGHHA